MRSEFSALKKPSPEDIEMTRMIKNALQARINRRLAQSKVIQLPLRKDHARVATPAAYAADLEISLFNCRAA